MNNKKIIVMLVLLVLLTGCERHKFSIEDSEQNFNNYYSMIDKIAKKYGYEIERKFDHNIDNQDTYMDIYIDMQLNNGIAIRMSNSAYESNTGVESFSISYKLNGLREEQNFNIDLFVELVNTMSGKEITKEFCDKFLNSSESKYPSSKYGIEKNDDEVIAKTYVFNFFEDWAINYVLNTDKVEVLTYGGLTKNL